MKDLYAGFMERLHWVPEPSSREFMFQLLPSIENMKLMLQFNAQILYIIAVEVSQKVSFLNGSAKKRNMICCKMYLRTRQQRSYSYWLHIACFPCSILHSLHLIQKAMLFIQNFRDHLRVGLFSSLPKYQLLKS